MENTVDESGRVAALSDEVTDMAWYELSLAKGANAYTIWADTSRAFPGAVGLWHQFGEPWHHDRWVMRIQVSKDQRGEVLDRLSVRSDIEHFGTWDREQDDRDLYGDYFWDAMVFFQASSAMAYYMPEADRPWMASKLAHCLLNAHGYGGWGEIRWTAVHLWKRITLPLRLKWQEIRTGRKWWAR